MVTLSMLLPCLAGLSGPAVSIVDGGPASPGRAIPTMSSFIQPVIINVAALDNRAMIQTEISLIAPILADGTYIPRHFNLHCKNQV